MESNFLEIAEVRGRNRWCGPAVISALTGLPTHDAAAAIRRESGQRFVKSTQLLYLRRALMQLGVRTSYQCRFPGGGDTLERVARRLPAGTYVVIVTKHGLTLRVNGPGDVRVIDNATKKLVPLDGYWAARKRVHVVFTATRSRWPSLLADVGEAKRFALQRKIQLILGNGSTVCVA